MKISGDYGNCGNGKAPTSRRTPQRYGVGKFGVRQLAGALLLLLLSIAGSAPVSAQPTDPITAWSSLKYGMFIHYGMATYTGRANENDPKNAAEPSTLYAPTNLDVDQWIRVAKDAGMKYAVLTAKHTAGHCLWDSKVRFRGKEFDYDVATSRNKTDVVAKFVKACKKYGVEPGLYWCVLDFRHNSVPPKPQWTAGKLPDDFFRFTQDQLTELIKNYPDVSYYWLDIPRAASLEQRRVIYDMIKRLRPGTVVLFNQGVTPPRGPLTIETNKRGWPTDVLNTERHPCKPGQFNPAQTWEGKTYRLGYEHCDTIGKNWFWFKGDRPRAISELYRLYDDVTAAGGNLLLNVAPDRTGRIPAYSVKALMELKQQIDRQAKVAGPPRLRVKVEERRLPSGDSELRLVDAQGKDQQTVTVNLSRHHQPATRADDPLMTKWCSWKYGAFLCFNSNQFSGQEHCTIRDPQQYAPTNLDVKQWVQTIKAAGMKYAVLTTSHTSGFLLWDSPTSEFDVANSGNQTDVVKAFVEECRRQDIVPGLYYCLWGGAKYPQQRRAEKRADAPRAVILHQLHELATRSGPIPYFWIDMMNWAPADLSAQEIYDLLKNVNPNCVVILNQHIQDGTTIKYFPTDVLNGEVVPPPVTGHAALRRVAGKSWYLPFEYEPCSQWRPGQKSPRNAKYVWFTYGAGKGFEPSRPYPAAKLFLELAEAYRRGASNVLLSCAPDHTGRFREADAQQLSELGRLLRDPAPPLTRGKPATASSVWHQAGYEPGKAVDGDTGTRWGAGEGVKTAWLEVDLGQPATINRAIIIEAYPELDRIRKFQIEYQQNGDWKPCHVGGRIGEGLEVSFPAVTAQRVRLHITEATDSPTIWEFQLFPAKQ